MTFDILLLIIAATVINSLVAFAGIFTFWFKQETLKKITILLVAFSAGTLIGGGFLHIAAESIEIMAVETVFILMITGFSVFFLMERVLFWRHCHDGVCDVHPYTYLILFGDGIHNFIDGIIIAASFIINPALGAITTFIIISHEFPQELGDFGVLVHGGMAKRKALIYNFISQITGIVGGIVGYVLSDFGGLTSFFLPFAAGGFIYIAASDLIPELHKEVNNKKSILSFVIFVLGVVFMYLIKIVSGV